LGDSIGESPPHWKMCKICTELIPVEFEPSSTIVKCCHDQVGTLVTKTMQSWRFSYFPLAESLPSPPHPTSWSAVFHSPPSVSAGKRALILDEA
jgi:hypothetical protein